MDYATAQAIYVTALALFLARTSWRLWNYAPPLPPDEFNEARFKARLLAVPFLSAFIYLSLIIFRATELPS